MSPVSVRKGRAGSYRSSGGRADTLREAFGAWIRDGGPGALGVVACMFASHLAYGADTYRLSMLLTFVVAASLSAFCVISPVARRALAAANKASRVAGLLFMASFVVALLQLTPWLPGGANPTWVYAPTGAPAVTLSRSDTLLMLIRLAGVGCVFLIGLVLARRAEFVARLFPTLLVGFGLFAVWALWSFLADPGGYFGYQLPGGASARLAASFSSANSAALLFAVGLVLGMADILRAFGRYDGLKGLIKHADRALPRLAPGLICALLCATDLILTQSRGGLVSSLIGLSALIALEALRPGKAAETKTRRLSLMVAGATLAIIVLGLVAYRPDLITRLLAAGSDVETRQTIFAMHWRVIQAAPWFGHGFGTFDSVNKLYLTSETYGAAWDLGSLHNVYLQWIEGVGVLGALPMFAAAIFANLAVAGRAFHRERLAGWRRGILCVSLVVCAMGLTDYGLEEPSLAVMWALLLGIGAAESKALDGFKRSSAGRSRRGAAG